jgi:hypothetical protein
LKLFDAVVERIEKIEVKKTVNVTFCHISS